MSAETRWFRLELPSDRDALPWVSHGLRGFLRATGWSRREAFRIDLAANEALDNAIQHGHHGDPGRPIQLSVEDDGVGITLEITDSGPGFDPETVQSLQEQNQNLAEGGRGLTLMRRLTDDVSVHCGPGCTRVVMRKSRSKVEIRQAS